MNAANTGGAAFPTGSGITPYNPGMTLRDYFATAAMAGIVQCTGYATNKACKDAAECAYEVADAMLKARQS
jgi:hypothetical protein